ncbi:MAG: LacI family DNA-binding transcriptional regulator [Verrucomicrobiota bacterium JB022]|nr:LacI family DNA-binding transcriptional regulator [Verrucomicrobiota bacterium JB022]
MPKRTTIRDIAGKTGYHYTTVSLALRDHPSIPEATREKIKEAAEELNYRRDPVLSALMAHRQQSARQGMPRSSLGWVQDPQAQTPWDLAVLQGLLQRSEALGYRVVMLSLEGDSPMRRAADLEAKAVEEGLKGLMISEEHYRELKPLQPPVLDRPLATWGWNADSTDALVGWSGRLDLQALVRQLRRQAYHRIGWVVPAAVRPMLPESAFELNPLLLETWQPGAFRHWAQRTLPCAIVSAYPEAAAEAEKLNLRPGKELGFITLEARRKSDTHASWQIPADEIGRAGADWLDAQIVRLGFSSLRGMACLGLRGHFLPSTSLPEMNGLHMWKRWQTALEHGEAAGNSVLTNR